MLVVQLIEQAVLQNLWYGPQHLKIFQSVIMSVTSSLHVRIKSAVSCLRQTMMNEEGHPVPGLSNG